MSIELKTDMKNHSITSYWGCDPHGRMLQITCTKPIGPPPDRFTQDIPNQEEGFIRLTLDEAKALSDSLFDFIFEECTRRDSLLKADLYRLKEQDKAIFGKINKLQPYVLELADLLSEFRSTPGPAE